MLRVRVCAAHMGGFLGPKFSKQGSLFRQIFHKQGWATQKLVKNSKKWVVFRQNSSKKWVGRLLSVIRRGYLFENRAADPRPSASHVPPPRDVASIADKRNSLYQQIAKVTPQTSIANSPCASKMGFLRAVMCSNERLRVNLKICHTDFAYFWFDTEMYLNRITDQRCLGSVEEYSVIIVLESSL